MVREVVIMIVIVTACVSVHGGGGDTVELGSKRASREVDKDTLEVPRHVNKRSKHGGQQTRMF